MQESKRKRADSGSKKKKKKKKKKEEEETDINDPLAYMDEPEFGLNPDYDQQKKEYDTQQSEKRKSVKEDPKAKRIKYRKSGRNQKRTDLTVRSLPWMKENWTNLKGNQEFGTYATVVTVDDQPFYFRANNTNDVGLAPMTLGTGSTATYVSSKARSFLDIGGELDAFIEKADKPRAMRKKIGASILKAIKSKKKLGCTSTGITGVEDSDLFAAQEMIAEVAAIWILDLCRSEGNDEAVLAHQEDLLTGTMTFANIFKPGVYQGMKAADLRV